jgi:hypothetical protein
VPTFVDRGVSRGQGGRSPTAVNLSFLDWTISISQHNYVRNFLGNAKYECSISCHLWIDKMNMPKQAKLMQRLKGPYGISVLHLYGTELKMNT